MRRSQYQTAEEAYEDYREDAISHGETPRDFDAWLAWLDDTFSRFAENAAMDQYEERRYRATH